MATFHLRVLGPSPSYSVSQFRKLYLDHWDSGKSSAVFLFEFLHSAPKLFEVRAFDM